MFCRTKTAKGQTYLQIVESYRANGQACLRSGPPRRVRLDRLIQSAWLLRRCWRCRKRTAAPGTRRCAGDPSARRCCRCAVGGDRLRGHPARGTQRTALRLRCGTSRVCQRAAPDHGLRLGPPGLPVDAGPGDPRNGGAGAAPVLPGDGLARDRWRGRRRRKGSSARAAPRTGSRRSCSSSAGTSTPTSTWCSSTPPRSTSTARAGRAGPAWQEQGFPPTMQAIGCRHGARRGRGSRSSALSGSVPARTAA